MKFFSSCIAVIAISLALMITYLCKRIPNPPDLDFEKWWGIGQRPREEETAIKPFNIDFNDSMIHDLKQRLRTRRPLTRTLEDAQSYYGMNSIFLETCMDYWLMDYNFKQRVQHFNRLPHFKTRIQGLDIHFIRVTPRQQHDLKVLPLLMLHGWPSSSKEFDKIIPLLTARRENYDYVFEVIAPDLPGFGFSEGTTKQGLNAVQIGIIMRNLMKRLGFEQFYVHAGDWGSQCATHMSTLFPDEILGFHTSMPLSSRFISGLKYLLGIFLPRLVVDSQYENRMYPVYDFLEYIIRESGYFHIQATKPDTIGVALTDSPVGLAAYIMEKMALCTNRDQLGTEHGGLEGMPLTDVLDTVTIAWATNSIVTSMRLYREGMAFAEETVTLHKIPTKVPTAAINFKYEVLYQSDWMLKDKFPNLVKTTTLDVGGHFSAMQLPQVLAQDIFEAAAKFITFNENHNRYR